MQRDLLMSCSTDSLHDWFSTACRAERYARFRLVRSGHAPESALQNGVPSADVGFPPRGSGLKRIGRLLRAGPQPRWDTVAHYRAPWSRMESDFHAEVAFLGNALLPKMGFRNHLETFDLGRFVTGREARLHVGAFGGAISSEHERPRNADSRWPLLSALLAIEAACLEEGATRSGDSIAWDVSPLGWDRWLSIVRSYAPDPSQYDPCGNEKTLILRDDDRVRYGARVLRGALESSWRQSGVLSRLWREMNTRLDGQVIRDQIAEAPASEAILGDEFRFLLLKSALTPGYREIHEDTRPEQVLLFAHGAGEHLKRVASRDTQRVFHLWEAVVVLSVQCAITQANLAFFLERCSSVLGEVRPPDELYLRNQNAWGVSVPSCMSESRGEVLRWRQADPGRGGDPDWEMDNGASPR